MADKEKQLHKILSRLGLKGRLKLVASLDEAHLVLVNERGHGRFHLTGKDSYLMAIEKGYIFPEEEVYYLVSTNPRDKKNIERKYLTNAFANIKPRSK